MKRKSKASYEANKYFKLKDQDYDYKHSERMDYCGREYKYTPNKYSKDTKYKVARFAKKYRVQLAEEKYNIPKSTVQRWVELFNKNGPGAFFKKGERIPDIKREEDPQITEEYPQIPPKKQSKHIKYTEIEDEEDDQMADDLLETHINLDINDAKLPNLEGWKKMSLISPSLRLWAAKEGIKVGENKKSVSDKIGVNISTLNKWILAYKTMGREAHLFKYNRKLYTGSDNGGRVGVTRFSIQFKKDAIDRALKEGTLKVGFQLGISPDTICKWKKILSYPKPVLDECHNIKVPHWWYEENKRLCPNTHGINIETYNGEFFGLGDQQQNEFILEADVEQEHHVVGIDLD